MSRWTELPLHFGMLLLSALLSILAELAVLHLTAKKTSGPLKIQQAKPVPESTMSCKQIKQISVDFCHSFLFSSESHWELSCFSALSLQCIEPHDGV